MTGKGQRERDADERGDSLDCEMLQDKHGEGVGEVGDDLNLATSRLGKRRRWGREERGKTINPGLTRIQSARNKSQVD